MLHHRRPYTKPTPAPLLKTREVAEALAISEPTVRRLARIGHLPRIRVGGSVRFRREDVERLVAAGMDPHEGEKPAGGPAPRTTSAASDGRCGAA